DPNVYTSARHASPVPCARSAASVVVTEPAHLGRTVEVEQEAESEVDGPVLDELARGVRERLCFLERLDRLVIQKLQARRLSQRHVAQPSVRLQLDAQLRVPVLPPAHAARPVP